MLLPAGGLIYRHKSVLTHGLSCLRKCDWYSTRRATHVTNFFCRWIMEPSRNEAFISRWDRRLCQSYDKQSKKRGILLSCMLVVLYTPEAFGSELFPLLPRTKWLGLHFSFVVVHHAAQLHFVSAAPSVSLEASKRWITPVTEALRQITTIT